MDEIWKGIKEYENKYQVSNLGRVRSLDSVVNCAIGGTRTSKGKILKQFDNGHGYRHLALSKNSKIKKVKVHRLVAQAFIPNPENKKEVNHLDFDPANNKVDNLEWATASENIQYSYDKGNRVGYFKGKEHKGKQGTKNHFAKLNVNDVICIKAMKGQMKQKDLASVYGVGVKQIWRIQNAVSWKHI